MMDFIRQILALLLRDTLKPGPFLLRVNGRSAG